MFAGHLGTNFAITAGLWKAGAAYGLGVETFGLSIAYLAADTWAQSQHYTPIFGEHAGNEINGWNAVRIRMNEYDERSIRNYMNTYDYSRNQATLYHEQQQQLRYIQAMERSKL